MYRSSLAIHSNEEIRPVTLAEELEAAPESRPSAVLLVARDLSLDESCRRTLSDAGVDVVVSVQSSKRALEVLGENQLFDAVVIGVGPGDVDAVMLAQHMRRHRSDTPTVVMSPIGNLEIPGAAGACRPNDSQLPNVLRKTIRKALTFRRSTRLRHPA